MWLKELNRRKVSNMSDGKGGGAQSWWWELGELTFYPVSTEVNQSYKFLVCLGLFKYFGQYFEF